MHRSVGRVLPDSHIRAFAFLNPFLSPIAVLLPFYVADHLHTTPDWYGFILAVLGIGSLLGYHTMIEQPIWCAPHSTYENPC